MVGSSDEGRALDASTLAEERAPIAILDFLANAEAVVERLGQHTCVPDWVLVRQLGDEWIVLASHGGMRFRPGDVLDQPAGVTAHLQRQAAAWSNDVVVDLASGRLEPATGEPAEDDAALCGVRSFPLWGGDGLFGAVCALPDTPEEEAALRETEPMVRLTVELLTSVLGLDLDRSQLQRRLDAAESAALSDVLTSLGNRRAFDRAIEREEARCARFGHHAGVVVLDLDDLKATNDTWGHEAGDDMIRRASQAIQSTLRTADQAFRVGGDEFALLLPEVSPDGLDRFCDRLADAMAAQGVSASVGADIRRPGGDLHAVARRADERMYERKRTRTGRRT
jgi:diguanylate cyclase (GGDEF)-like protein